MTEDKPPLKMCSIYLTSVCGVWITLRKPAKLIMKPGQLQCALSFKMIFKKISIFTHSNHVKAASNDSHGLTINVLNVSEMQTTRTRERTCRQRKRRDHNATPSALTSTRFLQHSQTSAASLKNIVVKKKTKHGC